MDFGIALPTPANSWKTVRRAEDAGFSTAWFYDTQVLSADIFVAMGAGFSGVGSEEARSIALALASVRRSNWACSFPAPSFHEDAARRAAMEGIIEIRFTSPYSP
jgi:hypothetical protein